MAEASASLDAKGRPMDESFLEHVRSVERWRQEVHAKSTTEPRSAAHLARFTIEMIALQLHLREIGPSNDRELDKVLRRLEERNVIPSEASLQFRSVQHHGNFWVHARIDASDPTPEKIHPLVASVDLVVEWYFRDYLKMPVPLLAPEREPLALSTSEPVAPDTTPTTFESASATLGTRWLDGEVIPIWRGPHGNEAGRLLVTLPEGGQPIELRIDRSRPSFVGRKKLRSDGSTANDLVVPIGNVSQDQACIEVAKGRVWLRNTAGKANVAVGLEWLKPGAASPLHHRVALRFGSASGVFLDSRLFEAAPESAVDPATGLLAREGLGCQIALSLTARLEKVALFARYSRDAEGAASRAALLLHEREPALPAARVHNVAVLVCGSTKKMEDRLEALRAADLAPSAAGWLRLSGESSEADARIEAALGALTRLAAAGVGADRPVDLARYAVPSAPLTTLAEQATAAYLVGGGVVLFVLDEVERLAEMQHPARAAVELEFREMLGAALAPSDRLSQLADGVFAVLTFGSAEKLTREQAARWHARGPVQVGAVEMDRCARSFPLPEQSLGALVSGGAAFARESTTGIDMRLLPAPIACPMDLAHREADLATRVSAVVKALERTWQLVACALAAAHRQRTRNEPFEVGADPGWAQPWLGVAARLAAKLREGDHRIAELARATHELASEDTGQMVALASTAARATGVASTPGATPEALEAALLEAEGALRTTLGALRPLRGWSLVAVRHVEALDVDGRSQRIDYTDFTGPHSTGAPERINVTGLPAYAFVYLVRWAEGQMVALDPWIRRARNSRTGADELFLIDAWPSVPGSYTYRSVANDVDIQLTVSARHLGK